MAQTLAIGLIVVLIAIRLSITPFPGLLKTGLRQWGTRSTILLSTLGLICAVAAIFLAKH